MDNLRRAVELYQKEKEGKEENRSLPMVHSFLLVSKKKDGISREHNNTEFYSVVVQ